MLIDSFDVVAFVGEMTPAEKNVIIHKRENYKEINPPKI